MRHRHAGFLLTLALLCAASSAGAQTTTQHVTVRVVPVTRIAMNGNSYSVVTSDPNARITCDLDTGKHAVAQPAVPVACRPRAVGIAPSASRARTLLFTIAAAP